MTNGLRPRRILAVSLLLGSLAAPPAQAQFMTGAYPVIVVPPPPAQGMVMPKKPPHSPPPEAAPPPQSEPDPGFGQNYQGRTRVR